MDLLDSIKNTLFLGGWLIPSVAIIITFGVVTFSLHQHLKTKGSERRFVKILSHKLRSPISIIKAASSELSEEKKKADWNKEPYSLTDFDGEMIDQILTEANRLNDLVNVLLEIIRSDQGRGYKFENIDITEIVRRLERVCHSDCVSIKFDICESPILIRANKLRIENILRGLVENAITYSPECGDVSIALKKGKKKVLFSVTDNGIGIISDEVSHIFTKFYKGKRASRVSAKGIGSGLFLAQKVVREHKGKIWFESKGKDKGSTFYVTLPTV